MDRNFNRTGLVDEYESFLWTERYATMGDAEIHTVPTPKNKALLKKGVYLSIQESDYLMEIYYVNISEDAEGAKSMVVKARDLTSLFRNRMLSANGTNTSWIDKGTVAQIIIRMVDKICITGTGVSNRDIIPNLATQNAATSSEQIDVDLPKQNLYTAISDLAASDNLGLRVELKGPTLTRLRLVIYRGIDRQNVVFSSTLDNLSEESYLYSDENYYNVAYVYAQDEYKMETVYAVGTPSTVTGLDRRVLFVDASDIDLAETTDADLIRQMKERGKAALEEHKPVALFDGKITNVNPFKYRIDYRLGDFVHFLDEDDVKKKTMVSEYIWASDAEGDRSYPTFAEPPTA